jgi:hypothetical protein
MLKSLTFAHSMYRQLFGHQGTTTDTGDLSMAGLSTAGAATGLSMAIPVTLYAIPLSMVIPLSMATTSPFDRPVPYYDEASGSTKSNDTPTRSNDNKKAPTTVVIVTDDDATTADADATTTTSMNPNAAVVFTGGLSAATVALVALAGMACVVGSWRPAPH